MYACAICGRAINDGAFLPGERSQLVCMGCFRARHQHEPMPENTVSDAHINTYGVRHKPGKPFKRPRITYVVSPINGNVGQVRRKIEKRNIIASINMAPGSYHY